MNSELIYAYYPGCSGLSTSKDYEVSTRAVCRALGITLKEVPDWSCCGSTPAHTVDHVFSAALSARNLALVEQMGLETVTTPCPSCLTNLKVAAHRMCEESFRNRVNRHLEQTCQNLVRVKSVLQVLVEDLGLQALQEKVQLPLTGLKVAPYYGCIMNRPPEIMDFDDPENPVAMDTILNGLGAEVLPFPLKVECCGASYGVARKDVVMHLSGKLLSLAESLGAEAIVTACPLCQMNLDLRQDQVNKALGTSFRIPVFYYTQLMGLALGLGKEDLLLEKLNVDPEPALEKIRQVEEEAWSEEEARSTERGARKAEV
ncbi:MAG: CoB--CoM heterodisulfide reductase iron-sulfur subunit B family protein [Desulfohalobiaceae bacterium]|nr:CoB--CoM heterodisulfide reductase iron-sulfur subunit B family protein [Desulfohalobiaceae bacterium]